jgi:hypothetical protein
VKTGLRFDWYSILSHSFFNTITDDLFLEVEKKLGFKRPNKARELSLRRLIKQVLSSLYSSFYSFPIGSVWVSYPLGSKSYSAKKPQLVSHNYDYAHCLFTVLNERKWLKVVGSKNQVAHTRIQVAGGLRKLFEEQGFKWSKQEPKPIGELVQVRDRKLDKNKSTRQRPVWKKVDMPPPNEPLVHKYQQDLFEFNSFLSQHCVSLNLTNDQLFEIGKEIKEKQTKKKKDHKNWMVETEEENKVGHLDLSRVQLRRIFSRNSLSKHGRFYGGWWQTIPSEYRPHILIDGKKTVEVDFSGMSLRILYGMNKVPYKGNKDIYDLSDNTNEGRRWKFEKTGKQRELIKRYINALLNDESGKFRLSDEEHKELGFTSYAIKKRFLKVHAPVADLINAGVGLETQFYDSEIAMDVMKFFMADGIPVLPIHDSFIIRAGFWQHLEKAMQTAFQERFGNCISVSQDGFPKLPEHFGMSGEDLASINKDDRKLYEVDVDKLYTEECSLMDGYVDGWRLAN